MSNNIVTANTNENRIAVLNLAISALAVERQIDLDTLGVPVEELPPAAKKMLREKIFPVDFLRSYTHLREKADGIINGEGAIRTNLGAVCSIGEAVDKVKALKDLQEQWDVLKDKDAGRYDQLIADHLLSLSQEAIEGGAEPEQVNLLISAIKEKQPRWDAVAAKLSFSYTVTPVTLDEAEFDAELFEAQRDSVVAIREGVLGKLIQFVCGEAKAMLDNLLLQEQKKGTTNLRVNPRTVERARNMTAKLKSLAFIHPLIHPLHTEIASVLDRLDPTEALTGRDYLTFKEICIALRDQTLVVERLEKGQPLIHVGVATGVVVSATASAPAQAQSQPVQTAVPVTQSQPAQATVPASSNAAPASAATAPVPQATQPAQPAVTTNQQTLAFFL